MTGKKNDSKLTSEERGSAELFCTQNDFDQLRKRARHAAPASKEEPAASASFSTQAMPRVEATRPQAAPAFDKTAAFPSLDSGAPAEFQQEFTFETMTPAQKPAKKAGAGKVAGVAIGALVVLAASVYIAGSVVFMSRFYPNTTMGGLDLSMKTADEAASMLAAAEEDYTLHVSGQGLDLDISSGEAGLVIDTHAIVAAALESANPWMWPFNIMGSHDAGEHVSVAADSAALDEIVRAAVEEHNVTVVPSEDATVVFDADAGSYVVKDEVYGQQISADAAIEQISKAMATMQNEVVLSDDTLIKPTVFATDARLASAAEKANAMVKCDVVLKDSMNGVVMTEVDGSDVSAWITFDENLEPSLDEAAMGAWAEELAASFNTVGTERTYTRPDGKTVTASGGDYGWAIDSAALVTSVKDAVVAGTVGELSVPCSMTGNGYTEPGHDWGAYCDVDLTEQHAYYYDASGNLLWDSGIVSGKPGEDATPTGVYYLKNLQTDVSLKGPIDPETNKPKWDSPVDYWMPFVGNMVGLHDASWQPSSVFSDSSAYQTYGSRGCVNLPVDKAGELFGIIQLGDPVIVHW